MSFNSIAQILTRVEQKPGWEVFRLYRQVLQCWKTLVSPQVAAHTRPLYIKRQVLWVATSSSAWAQNLAFSRYRLLKQLNAQLDEPLLEIRFSSAGWHTPPTIEENLSENHPSFMGIKENDIEKQDLSVSSPDLQTAFSHWVESIRKLELSLPLCPRCHAPTPTGELQRWSVCACCSTKL